MTIPPRKLSAYFKTLAFPVEIYPEEGDDAICVITKTDLMQMIENEAVFGIGSWKKIKRLRIMKPMAEAFAKVSVAGRITAVPTIVRVLPNTYTHRSSLLAGF